MEVSFLDEVFDTFDAYMNWMGEAPRQEVHRLGLWHQTFHCWILHHEGNEEFFVLQRRHESKDTHPNKLDISCAGHLEAGETPPCGVRELREELGLEVPIGSLQKIGVIQSSFIGQGVQDNEFCHVFLLVRHDFPLECYTPALGEVSGLYLIRVSDMQNLCYGLVNTVTIRGYEVDDNGCRLENTLAIGREDMVWHGVEYYDMLFSSMD